jgi:arylsulfatase A-like enzyme
VNLSDCNVLVVVSDTLRRDHVTAYGREHASTPHLERFASQAVVFDRHVIGSFPTMPARVDLLTGLLAFTFMGWEPLPAHHTTLPQVLSDAGWLTAGVVDTPFFVRNGWGYDRGFDDFLWVRGQGDATRPSERADARRTWIREADRFAARTMAEADDWLERHHREKFFLYVDTWDPHEPWDPPDYYTRLYEPGFDGEEVYPSYTKLSESDVTPRELALAHALYKGEVTLVDRWVGFLLDKLRVLGIEDRTIVLFLSDHGFYFGEHDLFGKADWVNAGEVGEVAARQDAVAPDWLRKSWLFTLRRSPLYQQLTRVPLLARVPGVAPGRRQGLTTAVDIPATILDLLGLDGLPDTHGRSFRRVLLEDEPGHRPFVVSSWPLYFAEGEYTSAVDGAQREIAAHMPITVTTATRSMLIGGPGEAPELYDLEQDPAESVDVWRQRTGADEELLESALSYLEECGTAPEFVDPRRASTRAT